MMIKKLLVSATVCLLVTPVLSHAGVYKCEIKGHKVYQQTPCSADVDVKVELRIWDADKFHQKGTQKYYREKLAKLEKS